MLEMLNLVYRKGVVTAPPKVFPNPIKQCVSAIIWLQLIVEFSFAVILAEKKKKKNIKTTNKNPHVNVSEMFSPYPKI